MANEEVEKLEEQVRELKHKQELREKEAELRKKKRVLELQDSWWGQILLGLKIYLEKTPAVLGGLLDWLIPPPEPGQEENRGLTHPDPDRRRKEPPEPDIQDPADRGQENQGDVGHGIEEELYQAMGGTLPKEED